MTRHITHADRTAASRLRKIYNTKKHDLHLTQSKLGESVGLSQSSVANYMRGEFPMNLAVLLKFAEALHVDAHEIDPHLDKRFSIVPLNKSTFLRVVGTLSGSLYPERTVEIKGLAYMTHHLAAVIDTASLDPVIEPGAVIILDPNSPYKNGDRIAVQYRENAAIVPYRLVEQDEVGITVKSFEPAEADKRDQLEEHYFPHKPKVIPYSKIATIYRVIGIQFPDQ